jgi:hypothetical protein
MTARTRPEIQRESPKDAPSEFVNPPGPVHENTLPARSSCPLSSTLTVVDVVLCRLPGTLAGL